MPKHRRRSRRFRVQPPTVAALDTVTHAPRDDLSVFRARMNAGDLDGILGARLRRSLRDVAADASLDVEIGVLRLALARLLNEERDPVRLAAAVSRITGVAVQAARLRQKSRSGLEHQIQAHLFRELAAIEAEHAEARQRQAESKEETEYQAIPDTRDW